VRVDLYLRLTGLLKTRTLAGKACDGGFVTLNRRLAKPSMDVAVGDTLSVTLPNGRMVEISVESVPETRSVSRSDRKGLYRLISGETAAG
jgi:ribosomal 50S subunit-recycling heat shock protein